MFGIRTYLFQQWMIAWIVIAFLILQPCTKKLSDFPALKYVFQCPELSGEEAVIGACCFEMRGITDCIYGFEAFLCIYSQRLFTEYVFPCGKGTFQHIDVEMMRRGNIDRICIGFFQCFV